MNKLKLIIYWMFLLPIISYAAPGDILFQDTFSRVNVATGAGTGSTATNGLSNGWNVTTTGNCNSTVVGNTGCAGIDSNVPPWSSTTAPLAIRAHGTGNASMFLRWTNVTAEHAVNLSGKPAAKLSYWARRGTDCFSEAPGDGNNEPWGCIVEGTITVGGTGSTSVSSIKVNGVEMLSGTSTASTNINTVASNIAAKLAANGFYDTAVSGSVVTFRGPGTLNGVWNVGATPVVTKSGTMTITTNVLVRPTPTAYTPLYGEEFLIEYLNSSSTWVTLTKYPNDGIAGEEIIESIDLPADALWAGFKFRFNQPGGSGYGATNGGATGVRGYDYWHIDDVTVTELAGDTASYTGAFCDSFEGGLSRWNTSGIGNVDTEGMYSNTGTQSMTLRWSTVTATLKPTDLTGVTGNITYWIKRGVGTSAAASSPNTSGSDLPDAGENLEVQYKTTSNTWSYLQPATTYVGAGTSGQTWNASIAIPADANKSSFQLRFKLLTGTGYDMDYWHVDDVCVGTIIKYADLSLAISPSSVSMVPGASTSLTATVTNNGPSIAGGPITITDNTPSGLLFTGTSSAGWTCSATSATTTCTYSGDIPIGGNISLIMNFTADPMVSGTFTNTVSVGATTTVDSTMSNNTKTNTYTFVPSSFEAYETTTTAGSLIGKIYTKIVGTSFNVKAIAKASGAINTTYNKTLTLSVIDGNATCDSAATSLTGFTITPASHAYVSGDAGSYTYALSSTTAYSNVKIRMTDSAGVVGCSSDTFTIRPSGFTVSSTNATGDTTGFNASAATVIATGENFNLTVDSSSPGYSGTAKIDNTKDEWQTGPSGLTGTVSGSFTTAATSTTGNSMSGNFQYDDVGYFRFQAGGVYDDTWSANSSDISSGDCISGSSSNVAVGGKYGCNIANQAATNYFGRFKPSYFELSSPVFMNRTDICSVSGCGVFTYLDEQASSTFTIKAMNSAGNVTKNYAGSFAKLALSTGGASSLGLKGVTSTGPTGLVFQSGNRLTINSLSGAWNQGIATGVRLDFTPGKTAAGTVDGPYLTSWGISPVDSDGVALQNAAFNLDTDIAVGNEKYQLGSTNLRFGKVQMGNVSGNNLKDLVIPLSVKYWNGTNWVTNADDSNTSIPLGSITFARYSLDMSASTTNINTSKTQLTMNSGAGYITLTKPGNTQRGSFDIGINLNNRGGTNVGNWTGPAWTPGTGDAATASASLPYLGVDTGSTNFTNDPAARVTFGLFKNNDKIIDIRENY